MAEPTDSRSNIEYAQPSIERAKMILTELACAAQSAALTAVDEQKARTAAQIGGIADAMRAAARSLERTQSPVAARLRRQCGAADRDASPMRSATAAGPNSPPTSKKPRADGRRCLSPAPSPLVFSPAAF